jgi:hypothetical protein
VINRISRKGTSVVRSLVGFNKHISKTFERHTSRVAEVFVDVTEVEKEEGKV